MVLTGSQRPECFPQNWELDYISDTKILIADCSLPDVQDLPKIEEVRYIQSRDEFKEICLAESATKNLYDRALYQTALRTIYELFQADVLGAIQSVVFNGWVRSVDRRTGQEVNACIMSLQVSREEFAGIKLAQVDPKECFRSLKGVAGAQLHGLAPVAPIMQINREDKRFIPSYAVADQIQEGYNLAAMDWEDFEHLIRELFEKEFSQAGGEVKVTRASRDGGVDAVIFDPDPIRGGKIVVQAKRYTNTVGVSAVRDLYGTLLNEGATKGILVSTAHYGPDAYEFAKGKPITLLDGGNLLHLLAKHGHKARIDLQEAKLILAEQEKAR
jgi:restriction system protein